MTDDRKSGKTTNLDKYVTVSYVSRYVNKLEDSPSKELTFYKFGFCSEENFKEADIVEEYEDTYADLNSYSLCPPTKPNLDMVNDRKY